MIDYEKYHKDGFAFLRIEDLISEDRLTEFNSQADTACQIPIEGINFNYVYSVLGKHNDPEWPFQLPLIGLEEKLKLSKELGHKITQKWYESKNYDKSSIDYFNNLTKLFIRNFYPEINDSCSNLHFQSAITVYLDGDYTEKHRDGQNLGRLCAVLIYLTPEHEYNNGEGELVVIGDEEQHLNGSALTPVRGNIAMLDFTNHNPFHEVRRVTNNFRRFCYLTFLWNTDKMPETIRPQGYK